MPTTSQWKTTLTNTKRAILTETGTTSTTGGTLPTGFSYEGYAARLLTTPEVNSACVITAGTLTRGELDICNYLMENTKYSSDSMGTYGYWLENPRGAVSTNAWSVNGGYRYVNDNSTSNAGHIGSRPVIEVSKSNMKY